MSSGGSDICIHFLSYSEGSEGGREGGGEEKEGWVGCEGLARRKQVRDEGLSGGYKGAVHWKRAGEPSMRLKNTDKTWEGRRHVIQWHRAPCLVQRASQKHRERKTEKDRMEVMDLLGSIVVVAVGGETGIYAGQKATEFSQLFI